MKKKIATIIILILCLSPVVMAVGPSEEPQNATSFVETEPVPDDNLNNIDLENKLRTTKRIADQTEATIIQNTLARFVLRLDTNTSENTTFYVHEDVVKISDNASQISLTVDGDERKFWIVTESLGSKWIGFRVPEDTHITVDMALASSGLGLGFISNINWYNILLALGAIGFLLALSYGFLRLSNRAQIEWK